MCCFVHQVYTIPNLHPYTQCTFRTLLRPSGSCTFTTCYVIISLRYGTRYGTEIVCASPRFSVRGIFYGWARKSFAFTVVTHRISCARVYIFFYYSNGHREESRLLLNDFFFLTVIDMDIIHHAWVCFFTTLNIIAHTI